MLCARRPSRVHTGQAGGAVDHSKSLLPRKCGTREEWEMRTRECTDEKEEELESWDIIEENLLDGIYEDFERAYLLRYAEDWCRENGIVCEETG